MMLLVGCAGNIIPKAPGIHMYKATLRTKYVKHGEVSESRLSKVVAENYQARKLAERSEHLTRMTWLSSLVLGGCLSWQMLEFDHHEQPSGRDYAALSCSLAALYATMALEHGATAARTDAINQYNNDLLVK